MSDRMRWRHGDSNPVNAAVDAETVIEIGNLIWQDTDDAKPASMVTEDKAGMELAHLTCQSAQGVFANNFLGVAMQRSRSGDTTPIRVSTTGVFEFDVLQGTCWELGDLVGCAVDRTAGDKVLENQAVAKVAEAKYAIGRIARRESAPASSVLVDIRSTVMTGGIA